MSEFISKLRDKIEECEKERRPLRYRDCSEAIGLLLRILNSEEEGKIRIVGQPEMNKRLVSALILNEHVLLEGLPGVAKTTAIKNLAEQVCMFFNRVQFIPDMQPSDLIGRRDIIPKTSEGFAVEWKDGPLFANLVLADEINRAPSKVQAALLESMGEKQITPFGMEEKIIRHESEKEYLEEHLPPAVFGEYGKIDVHNKESTQFSIFATMNPIEVEGTYPLSEAQVDRFCFKTIVNYPNYENLLKISEKVFQRQGEQTFSLLHPKSASPKRTIDARHPNKEDFILSIYFLQHCRRVIFERDKVGRYAHIDHDVVKKIAQIVYFSNYKFDDDRQAYFNDPEQLELQMRMRKPEHQVAQKLLGNVNFRYIQSGASPRGIESLLKASLCEAFMDGEEKVGPEYVKRAAYDVLRHRIRLTIQAKTQNISSIDIIDTLLNTFLG